MTAIWPYAELIFGFVLLIKGADILVEGAVSIARRLRISDLVIGMTVVAFGTSAPELFVNITAAIKGNSDLAIGNILGSNIANTLLVLGVASVIRPMAVTKGTVWREIPFSLLAAIVFALLANDWLIDQQSVSAISRGDGLVLLCFFIVFLYYAFTAANGIGTITEQVPSKTHNTPAALFRLVGGLVGLCLGGRWIVSGAVAIATHIGLSESVVGLSIVAVGTSLPELATSATAAYRGKADIAVGNIVGSNIFNIFFVLGVTATITPLPFNLGNNIDVLMTIFTGLLLFAFMFSGGKARVDRWEGALAVIVYAVYIFYRFVGP